MEYKFITGIILLGLSFFYAVAAIAFSSDELTETNRLTYAGWFLLLYIAGGV